MVISILDLFLILCLVVQDDSTRNLQEKKYQKNISHHHLMFILKQTEDEIGPDLQHFFFHAHESRARGYCWLCSPEKLCQNKCEKGENFALSRATVPSEFSTYAMELLGQHPPSTASWRMDLGTGFRAHPQGTSPGCCPTCTSPSLFRLLLFRLTWACREPSPRNIVKGTAGVKLKSLCLITALLKVWYLLLCPGRSEQQ
ncbi:hypothetical protein EK904_011803 [Melospiza melodia maxima]|nr:hypothetical protein EK904_011803 [Melospiza melodia maxima]